jgi:acylphosphatase
MTSPCEQRIVRFVGRVQGVGFRYTACRTARDYAVGGYVRNMPDGSVECVVEGAKAEIDSFVEALCQRMADYVDRKTEQSAPSSGRYRSFDVRF